MSKGIGARQQMSSPEAVIRKPMMSANDINHILVNGAQIALNKLKRATSFNARVYYFAEIGVYFEVSLSSGSDIEDEARLQIYEIHKEALSVHMHASKSDRLIDN